MAAQFCAYPPDEAAIVRLLDGGAAYRIGRAETCELRIEHPSVSRFHADLSFGVEGWRLRDLGSKNGVRVDGSAVASAVLPLQAWFSVGDVYCSLEMLDAAAAARLQANIDERRAISRSMSARFSPVLGIRTLIPQALESVLELSGLERGFALYAPAGQPLRVCAMRQMSVPEIASPRFDGSASAIDRALLTRQGVICCDTTTAPWLGMRPSVRLGGIRALVCLPLRVAENTLGAIYADSRRPGAPISELDLELLEGVADHAAMALDAHALLDEVEAFVRAAAEAGVPARWDELRAAANE